MKARVAGDEPRARDFLSPTALEQYGQGEGGLTLTGTSRFAGWDFVSVNAADANAWEVTVRVRQEGAGSTFQETLFVGPGPDASGAQRTWIVRGAARS
jgi:hypothetical protein